MNAKEIAAKAIKKADEVQVSISRGNSTGVSFEYDKLKSVKSEQTTGISVTVIKDGLIGSSHSTDLSDTDGAVARALEAVQFGSKAHFSFPGPAQGSPVKEYDESVDHVSKAEMIDIGEQMKTHVKGYSKDILFGAGIHKSSQTYEFANSAGNEFSSEHTRYSVSCGGERVEGTDILFTGDSFSSKRKQDHYMDLAEKTVELIRMAKTTADVSSGEMTVIFPPEGIMVLLLALRLGLNGKNVFHGTSPLKGRAGETITHESFSLVDDPLVDFAGASSVYDGEGVSHKTLPLIENGELKAFLYDLDTAGRAGVKSTGHGPGCGPTNWIIGPGSLAYEEMISEVENGLLVYSVLGLGQGNAISGEFSCNVYLGYRIEKGRITGRVKDVMIAGNAYDALKNITGTGSERKWVYGSVLAPALRIGALSVTAKRS